jgi:hypothetical protein
MILTGLTSASLITAISTVGFPIVACGALFWYIQKENASNRDKIDKLSDTINANTAVMGKLLERLDKE